MRKIALTSVVFLILVTGVSARPQMPVIPQRTHDVMAISYDGKIIATSCSNPFFPGVDLISAKNNRGIGILTPFKSDAITPAALAFSPKGDRLAALGSGKIVVWDATKTGTEILSLNLYDVPNPALSGAFRAAISYAPDGRSLVSIAGDCNLRRWDAENGKLLKTLSLGDATKLSAATLSTDGNFAASAHDNGKIHIWSTDTNAIVKSLQFYKPAIVRALALSKDGKRLVASVENDPVAVRRVTNLFRQEIEGVNRTIVFDVQTGERLFELRSTFSDVQFSPTGKSIITCDLSGSIRIYEVATGKLFRTMPKDTAGCNQVIPFADGIHVACRWPSAIAVWNMTTSERVMGK